MLDLSIIIVNWNGKRYLVECLESLRRNVTLKAWETIVVDNGSTDGSIEAVREGYPEVKLIETGENLGFARGNNVGLREAQGRYLCLMNSDIVVRPMCLELLVRRLEACPGLGMIGPRVINRDGSLQPTCAHFPGIWNNLCRTLALDKLLPDSLLFSGYFLPARHHDRVRSVEVLSGCFWVIRRAALEQAGLLDENFFIYSEDVDYCRRVHGRGWGVQYYPPAEAIHYGGASSANAPVRFLIEMHRATIQYWLKYGGATGKAYIIVSLMIYHVLRVITRLPALLARPGRRQGLLDKVRANLSCVRWLATDALHIKIPKGTA